MPADFLDRYSAGDSVCHRWPAMGKLLLAMALILTSVVLPISQWPLLGCLLFVVFGGLSIARIPMAYLLRRALWISPMLAGIAVSVVVARGWDGAELAATIVTRAFASFLVGLWLVNVTPFEKLLVAVRRLGMPSLFVAMLAMMYRYLFVVFDEFARMQTARRARTFGPRRAGWAASAQLLGHLLIRTVDRAERIHGAMCSRGWNGRIRTLDAAPAPAKVAAADSVGAAS